MTLPRSAPEMQIVTCSIRLLAVHLDASEQRTSQAVAVAVERMADALVTWHDAVVAGAPDHIGCPSRPQPVPTTGVPGTIGDVTPGLLERVSTAARTTARELDVIAQRVSTRAAEVAAGRLGSAPSVSAAEQLAEHGQEIAGTLRGLAESVAELGEVAARERHRSATDLRRAATSLRRAEHSVRRTANTAGRLAR